MSALTWLFIPATPAAHQALLFPPPPHSLFLLCLRCVYTGLVDFIRLLCSLYFASESRALTAGECRRSVLVLSSNSRKSSTWSKMGWGASDLRQVFCSTCFWFWANCARLFVSLGIPFNSTRVKGSVLYDGITAALLGNIIQKSGFFSFCSASKESFISWREERERRVRVNFGLWMHGVELWPKCDLD